MPNKFADLGVIMLDDDPYTDGESLTKKFEGFSGTVYDDTVGKKTVGYGFNIHSPAVKQYLPDRVIRGERDLTKQEADMIFPHVYKTATEDAKKFVGEETYNSLPDQVKNILNDMSYNLGAKKLATFKKMRKALQQKDFKKASEEMKDSRWYKQVGDRSKSHFEKVKTFIGDLGAAVNPFHVKQAEATDTIFGDLGFIPFEPEAGADEGDFLSDLGFIPLEEKKVDPSFRATPEKGIIERIKDKIGSFFKQSEEERTAEALNIYAISKQTGIPLNKVEENIEQLQRDSRITGIKPTQLTNQEYQAMVFMPLIGTGLAATPVTTTISVAAFTALDKLIDLNKFVPSEANDVTKTTVELADFVLKAGIVGGMVRGATKHGTKVVETVFQKKLEQVGLPQKMKLSRDQTADIFQTGRLSTKEQQSLFAGLGLTRQQRLQAVKKGIEVEIPAERMIQMVDKPGWSKFKKVLKIEAAAKKFPSDPLLQTAAQRRVETIKGEPKIKIGTEKVEPKPVVEPKEPLQIEGPPKEIIKEKVKAVEPVLPEEIKEIPQFKSTEAAVSYGQSIKDQPDSISALEQEAERLKTEASKLLEAGKEQEYITLVSGQKQFVNEALQEAKKEIKPEKVEEVQKGEKVEYKIKVGQEWKAPTTAQFKKQGVPLKTKKITSEKAMKIIQDSLTDVEISEEGEFLIIKGYPKKPEKLPKSLEGYGDPLVRPADPVATPSAEPEAQDFSTRDMPMRYERPRGDVKTTNTVKIIDSMADAAKAFGHKVPIRVGRFRQRAMGIFKPDAYVIRTKTANDIVTASHELGHYLEVWMRGGKSEKVVAEAEKGKVVNILDMLPDTPYSQKAQSELVALGRKLYGSKEPHNGYESEGIAEFTRMYLTNPGMAKEKAPDFFGWFEGDFLKKHEKGKQALETTRELFQKWQEQGSVERVKESVVDTGSLEKRWEEIKARTKRAVSIEAHIEMFEPLRIFAKEAAKSLAEQGEAPLGFADDPFLTAQALRTTHDARVKYMVDHAMIDIAGNPVGGPLTDIQSLVRGEKEDFTVYLVAKRALALWDDPLKPGGRNSGIPREDAIQTIKELETDNFKLAAQKVYDWNNGVLMYVAQSSPSFARVVKRILEIDPGFYVPFSREFREIESIYARSGTQAKARTATISKRLKESGRRIKDPFPQMIANARANVKAAHNRVVIDQIIKLSKVPHLGHLVEKVPPDMIPKASRSLFELFNEVSKSLAKVGIESEITPRNPQDKKTLKENKEKINELNDAVNKLKNDRTKKANEIKKQFRKQMNDLQEEIDEIYAGMASDMIGETITFFAPATTPKGKDPIIPIWNKDKIEYYQVDRELYRTLDGMEVYRLPDIAGYPILDWIFGKPTRVFRAGTTGLRASFGLVVNPQRDLQTLYMNTQSNVNAFHLFHAWGEAMRNAFLWRTTKKADPYMDAFVRLGGEMAQPLGQDIPFTRRAAKTLFQGKVVRTIDPRNWFDFIRDFLQFPETAPRVAELKLLAKKIGWKPGTPMTLGQSLQLLLAAKQVTTDFTAQGEFARIMNQIAPFYNAAIQGPRANIRAGKRNPKRFFLRGMSFSAATLALWWSQKDEEWYKQLKAREKFMYWHFSTDFPEPTLLRMPRAFEIGMIFSALPEALMDSWYRQDPEAVKEWWSTFFETSTPNITPVLLDETFDQYANKDRFWESPIVKQSLQNKPPEEQYDEYSTRVAIKLGDIFKVSPKRIDHAIQGVFGYVAGDVIEVLGLGPSDVDKDPEVADLPVIGRMFLRGGPMGTSPKAIGQMYDLLEEARLKQYSEKHKETEEERQLRLMLKDGARAVSLLYYIRGQTKDSKKRREITAEALRIANEVTELYNSKKPIRELFAELRRKYEYQRDQIKQLKESRQEKE